MRFYIVGLNVTEAQGYAMRMKREQKGHQVRLLSVETVKHGALRGLSGENVEVTILPRAWAHKDSHALVHEVEALNRNGVKVTELLEVD